MNEKDEQDYKSRRLANVRKIWWVVLANWFLAFPFCLIEMIYPLGGPGYIVHDDFHYTWWTTVAYIISTPLVLIYAGIKLHNYDHDAALESLFIPIFIFIFNLFLFFYYLT